METHLFRLQTIVGKQFGIEINQIKPEANFGKELSADSLDVLKLVMSIEDEFEMDIEHKAASQIETVQDALNYIEGRCDKN
jgi:acyl carrier protein